MAYSNCSSHTVIDLAASLESHGGYGSDATSLVSNFRWNPSWRNDSLYMLGLPNDPVQGLRGKPRLNGKVRTRESAQDTKSVTGKIHRQRTTHTVSAVLRMQKLQSGEKNDLGIHHCNGAKWCD